MGKPALNREQIEHIIDLRQRGNSIPEIKKSTGHGKATIFKYIRGVKILPEFLELWRNKRNSSALRAIQGWKNAQDLAKKIVERIERKEKILIAASLYWAEGTKRDFSLSNTDPALIKVFVECLEELGVRKENLKVTIRIYDDLDREKVVSFWSKIIGIPKENISNINVLKGKKKGKLEYGMCRVRVPKGAKLLKLLHSLADVIKENIGAPVVQRIEQRIPKSQT